MSGAIVATRDLTLPARAGDAALCPDPDEVVLDRVVRSMSLPDGARPAGARLTYVRWKPRVSTTALYRIDFHDAPPSSVTWKKYADGKARDIALGYEPDRRAREQAKALAPFVAWEDEGLCMYAFPTDRELPGLARAVHLRRTARRLNEIEPWPGEAVRARRSTATLVRYKPEHRAVLRLDLTTTRGDDSSAHHRIAARVLAPDAGDQVSRARAEYAASTDAPLAPRLIGVEERTGILFEEWIEGESCSSVDFGASEAAGALLAALHRARPPRTRVAPSPSSPRAELGALFSVDSELERRFAALALEHRPPPTAWVHGDFHPDQLLRTTDGRTVLLDWDALRPGHPLEDLATWIADEIALDPRRASTITGRALLAAYARAGGEIPAERELRAQIGSELVRRAAAGIRRLESGGIERARSLLAAASRLLDDPGSSA